MLTAEILQAIVDFEANAKRIDFHRIFGEHLGNHLWRKFVERDHSLVIFYCGLDLPTAKTFLNHFNQEFELQKEEQTA